MTITASAILHRCARIEMTEDLRGAISSELYSFNDWDTLLKLAEKHGMGPLLLEHLQCMGVEFPAEFLRGLRFLKMRHDRTNQLLMEELEDVLALFAAHGLRSLVLKGGALCQTTYPRVGLRPMRDLDLLMTRKDACRGHELLMEEGFRISGSPVPDGYYHLSPLIRQRGDQQITIEIHHGLFPADPPYYQNPDFEEMYLGSKEFLVGSQGARCMGDVEMLNHLFQHGFHPPLSYEGFKVISAADIVSIVEEKVGSLDWGKIRKCYPNFYTALPHFHHLTPWSERVINELVFSPDFVPSQVGVSYSGWPKKSFRGNWKKRWSLLLDTLLPGQWWMLLYYGGVGRLSLWRCRYVSHPVLLLKWVKASYLRKG